ncbi:phosphatase PAP2 family protein [Altererythrobacter indicus]|uniref:Phosphatase PAP2 family protein n=1 Tax=Altericroceibacterium indicum TaxID=374177 RepID=A0A845A438_9SPHN|nr:phosphatase PAP2 family protein [Altericroceibacterium indicum]MXP24950.1 phosphatase PAP2 family protein [Altericroceibacterium indicum]
MRDITAMGGVALRNIAALIGITALVLLHQKRQAAILAMIILSGWLAETAVKYSVERARPDILGQLTHAGGPSFPSGHSFNAALVALALTLAFTPFVNTPILRKFLVCTAVALSFLVAFSRVWLGVHYVSDVMAGWLGGTAWALCSAQFFATSGPHTATETCE